MATYYLVWVDDSPQLPESPLTAREAVREFEREIRGGEEHVEIRVCGPDELEFAGIDPDDQGDEQDGDEN